MSASSILHLSESKVSVTKAAEDSASWLHTERGIIAQVEVFFVLSVLLHAVQVVFGWWRRCSSNTHIRHLLWLAYTINPPLLIYTLGLARSSPSVAWSELLRACAFPYVMALAGTTNSMTAYSVDDNKQSTRRSVQQLLCVLSLVAMWKIDDVSKLTDFRSITALVYAIVVYFLLALMISMNGGRIYASMATSSSLDKESRDVQVHMKSGHLESTNYDPVTLAGYGYLVCDKIDDSSTAVQRIEITVDRIWSCEEGLLGTSDGKQLKEVSLSFALFRLMRRRFFGLTCPESKLQKTRDLVLKGLLLDCEAAHRVIEAELAFAHDHFFTSVASGNTELGKCTILLGTAKAVIYPLRIIATVKDFIIHSKSKGINSTGMVTAAVLIMLLLLSLELLQLYLYLSSDWAKVQLVRRSISGKDIPFRFDRFYSKLPWLLGYWQNKIGQHALLQDLHGRSGIYDTIGSISGHFFGECLGYRTNSSKSTDLPRPKRIQLTGDVKLAIAQTLKGSDGNLSNGTFSLRR
jgi:hypothetical protein